MAAKESEKDIAQQIKEKFRNPQTKVDEIIRLYDQWKDYDKVSWYMSDSRKKRLRFKSLHIEEPF